MPTSTTLRLSLEGCLTGTAIFGVLMSALGMMPMVAALVGSQSVLVGWLVHLVIGGVFSVPFAFVLESFPQVPATLVGLVYGLVVWLFGPLLVMPLWLGMPAMVFNLGVAAPWWSLAGHAIFGFVAGLVVEARHPSHARLGDWRPTPALPGTA